MIGGTGPTGIWIVNGLLERGWDVTILHRGAHERAEVPADVEHLHHDPFDVDDLTRALDGRWQQLAEGLEAVHDAGVRGRAQPHAARGDIEEVCLRGRTGRGIQCDDDGAGSVARRRSRDR